MTLSEHSLRQIDEASIDLLSEAAVRALAIKLLNDLKEARERLNRNAQNSSVPQGSETPWEKGVKYSDDEDNDGDALEDDGEGHSPEASSEVQATENNGPVRKPGKQPGAQGYRRMETVPLHGQAHHHLASCAH